MIEDEVGKVKRVIDTWIYPVGDGNRVQLTITVGDGQVGGSSYSLRGRAVQGSPNFENAMLNPGGESLQHSVLNCVAKVMDIREDTDRTSVTVTLSGGPKEMGFEYSADVSENHGFAEYHITVALV